MTFAERTDEDALLHEARPQPINIVDPLHLDDADRALHAHVLARRGMSRHGARPSASAAEIRLTCSSRGSRSNRSSEALAAAQASALAMKVGPCISACLGSSDQNASNTLRRAIVAASGSVPPVSAFPTVMMSGTTPACSQANIVPVRPKPVKISSKISSRS